MNLALALKICNTVVANCEANKFAPVAVCVVDAAGHEIVTQRMDHCLPSAYPKFAHAKAMTCISMKMSSRAFRDRYTATGDPAKFCQMLAMTNITQGNLAPFPGGVLILQNVQTNSTQTQENWQPIGAVGVSGAAADEDEFLALQGAITAFNSSSTIEETSTTNSIPLHSPFRFEPATHALTDRNGLVCIH